MRKLKVNGTSMETARATSVTLNFDDHGKLLNPRTAATSSLVGWGKWQASCKVPCSFGDLWWCSTAGHGGFILVTQQFYGAEGPRPWFKDTAYKVEHEFGKVYVYEFEEDCDWALLVYQDPKVLEAEVARYNKQGHVITAEEFLRENVLPTLRHYNKWVLKPEDLVAAS